MNSKKFLVGSRYFFQNIEGFESKDIDEVIFLDNTSGFTTRQTSSATNCLFEWKRMKPEEYVAWALKSKLPMSVGKWLVKEVCDEVYFTLNHLKQLKPVFEKMDGKHAYEKIIFEAILKNKSWTLTDAQLQEAYESYKKARE